MNHAFNKNLNNLCAVCSRVEHDHTSIAQCECCPNIGDCEVIDNMLMCASCQLRDKQIKQEVGIEAPNLTERENLVARLVAQISKNQPLNRRQYFVGQIKPIVDIEAEIALLDLSDDEKRFTLAQVVEKNLIQVRRAIVENNQAGEELRGAAIADQKYLNQLVPQLREEEREKFKLFDINYKPTAVTASVTSPKPRMSASDKAIESFAKMLGISVEQAKLQLNTAAAQITKDIPCTCQVTPGFCKKHPSK